MSKYTKEDIWRMIEEEDVEFIRLQFTDIFGTLKNVAVTTSQLERVLNNEIMFDGASIEGFARVEQSDMFLRPDLDTFAIFPWRPQQGKVARFLCDIYRPDGTPFAGDPRHVLKRTVQEAAEMGYQMNVNFSCFTRMTREIRRQSHMRRQGTLTSVRSISARMRVVT